MSTLYTINGNYPNKYFAFTLTPENMSMANANHQHAISAITNLEQELDQKADASHTHTCVEQLYSTQTSDSAHNVTLTIDAAEGDTAPSMTVNQNKITLSYASNETHNIQQVDNKNNAEDNQTKVVMITTEPTVSTITNKNYGILHFKENKYV